MALEHDTLLHPRGWNLADARPWLAVRITQTPEEGVDARVLSRLLVEFADSMILAARWRLGDRKPRRGPPTVAERRLAALRVATVSPGSLDIAYMEPPGLAELAPGLPGMEPDWVTPDDIASVALDEFDAVGRADPIEPGKEQLRRSTLRFLNSVGKVGGTCELSHRAASGSVRRARIAVDKIEAEPTASVERPVRLFGHAYMVDVEPGRLRVRVRTPSESEFTMDVAPEARDALAEVLDRPVRIDAVETLVKGFVTARRVERLEPVQSAESGPERPPRTLLELAASQGLLSGPVPDYVGLASDTWETPDDLAAVSSYLAEVRRAVG